MKFYNAYKNNLSEYCAPIIFLLETMMRGQEFLPLTLDDIDFENNIIHIRSAVGERFVDNDKEKAIEKYIKVPKNRKERIVYMTPLAREVVEYMISQTQLKCRDNPQNLLYPSFNRHGKMRSMDAFEIQLKALCDKIGVDRDVRVRKMPDGSVIKKGLNVHALRHTAITLANSAHNATNQTIRSISNGSASAIIVQRIVATEYNDWKLVSEEKEILADTKELAFALDDTQLFAGENQVDLRIESNTEHTFGITVKRGAWSKSIASEVAFSLEFQYEIEKREFTLCLVEDDYGTQTKYQVKEGNTFILPTPKQMDYVFMGWEDTSYRRYTGSYVMPSKNVTLKALWKMPSYALYTGGNQTLTFLQTDVPYKAGQSYKGVIYGDIKSIGSIVTICRP